MTIRRPAFVLHTPMFFLGNFPESNNYDTEVHVLDEADGQAVTG